VRKSAGKPSKPEPGTGARQCYHCKEWIAAEVPHDCWTTTEGALTRGLSDDLREAYLRLRDTAAALGEQRIYASHNSIMFARKTCYFFVRPQRKFLEVCIFLGRAVSGPVIRKVTPVSKTTYAHMLRVVHRDEVEGLVVEWLREGYDFCLPG